MTGERTALQALVDAVDYLNVIDHDCKYDVIEDGDDRCGESDCERCKTMDALTEARRVLEMTEHVLSDRARLGVWMADHCKHRSEGSLCMKISAGAGYQTCGYTGRNDCPIVLEMPEGEPSKENHMGCYQYEDGRCCMQPPGNGCDKPLGLPWKACARGPFGEPWLERKALDAEKRRAKEVEGEQAGEKWTPETQRVLDACDRGEDAARKSTLRIEQAGEPCEECDGLGTVHASKRFGMDRCPKCHGKGVEQAGVDLTQSKLCPGCHKLPANCLCEQAGEKAECDDCWRCPPEATCGEKRP